MTEITAEIIRIIHSGQDVLPQLRSEAKHRWQTALTALLVYPQMQAIADRLETVELPQELAKIPPAEAALAHATETYALERERVTGTDEDRRPMMELQRDLTTAQNSLTRLTNHPRVIELAIERLRAVPAADTTVLEQLGLVLAAPSTIAEDDHGELQPE